MYIQENLPMHTSTYNDLFLMIGKYIKICNAHKYYSKKYIVKYMYNTDLVYLT